VSSVKRWGAALLVVLALPVSTAQAHYRLGVQEARSAIKVAYVNLATALNAHLYVGRCDRAAQTKVVCQVRVKRRHHRSYCVGRFAVRETATHYKLWAQRLRCNYRGSSHQSKLPPMS
jgi:hypothetical protein